MKSKITLLVFAAFTSLLLNSHVIARPIDIQGSVLYHQDNSKPVPSVTLRLYSVPGNTLVAETKSKANGSYIFRDMPYGKYRLTATTSIKAGGVNMGDAYIMLLHIKGLYELNEMQKLASDLDHDGNVTYNDYTTLVNYWFVQGYPFQPDWIFQDIIIDHNGTKTEVPPMGGSSSGDVNGSFVPTMRSEEIVDAVYNEKNFSSEFKLDVYANDITSASGMGLVIDYPSNVDISTVTCPLSGTNMNVSSTQIRISWINEKSSPVTIDPSKPILVISGNTNEKYSGGDVKLTINDISHFSDFKGEKLSTRFTIPVLKEGEFLGNNYPNPFKRSTTINFYLPQDANVSLNIYNQNGQLVRSLLKEEMTAGEKSTVFNAEGLSKGVYYYNLRTNTNINETKKLIVL